MTARRKSATSKLSAHIKSTARTSPNRKTAVRKTTRKTSANKTSATKTSASKTSANKTSANKTSATKTARRASPKRWSRRVTEHSDALDLRQGVFKLTSAKQIASSLKRSAEQSSRRKTGAYRSALSMLTFYINRAGRNLPKVQRDRLERAKAELKQQFGRE
jgi:hypothetical protein